MVIKYNRMYTISQDSQAIPGMHDMPLCLTSMCHKLPHLVDKVVNASGATRSADAIFEVKTYNFCTTR